MLDQSYYAKADEIMDQYGRKPASLIPIMQEIQGAYRYLPGGAAELCGRQNRGDGGQGFQRGDVL